MDKIITLLDLANMIANDELDDKTKFVYDGDFFLYYRQHSRIDRYTDSTYSKVEYKDDDMLSICALKEPVRLIYEESKQNLIEPLEIGTNPKDSLNSYITNEFGTKCYMTKHSRMIANKVNELVDKVNMLLEKDDDIK